MSAGRLDTVLRVAALRQAGARAAVGAATAAVAVAERDRDAALTDARAAGAPNGPVPVAQAQLAGGVRRAEAAGTAELVVQARRDDRTAALQAWASAARRERLLAEVCARHRTEAAEAAERRTQSQLDDLAGRRPTGPTP